MTARWLRGLVLGLAAALGALAAQAQTLESALSPGPLIRDHAKAASECKACHVPFDRAAQDALCTACHKEVGADIRQRTGLHGRQPPRACRGCHTDHRGRDVRIAEFDAKAFDHRTTDHALLGKHAGVDCAKCHPAGRKYREAPVECQACHRKDDVHKASLGTRCGDCHTEQRWSEARVDHDATRFPLTGRHVQTKCADCHRSAVYEEAPDTCIGCHRKDDKHKARFGEKCESCHTTKAWPAVTFRHDTDTRYALRGRHREVRCDSCHTAHLYRDKPGSTCVDCHRKDDKHEGTLGTDCQSCHGERSWKEPGRFDHDRSSFPLRGGHAKASCTACHKSPQYKQAPSECVACHRKDDRHEGTLGSACAECHTDRDWKAARFDHARTRFALRLGHATPPRQCTDCHRTPKSFRPTATDCFSCHAKDDKHEGGLGPRCESCHGESHWKTARFDHATARFALVGSHVRVPCAKCHESRRYRDAPRECVACHGKDDKHGARFGAVCASCHNARDWRLWAFDHQKQTDYRLEGTHAGVACEACHVAPAPAGRKAAALEQSCVACHRRDDIHDGTFGPRCDQCHQPTRWKQVTHRPRTSALPPPPGAGSAGSAAERRPS